MSAPAAPPPVRVLALACLAALALAPAHAHHGDTLLPYLEASGRFAAGLVMERVEGVNVARLPFAAHPCHGDLRVFLSYAPQNASVQTERAGVSVPYRFELDIVDVATGEPIEGASWSFATPGAGRIVLPPEHARGNPLRADLAMTLGADAEWSLAVRGWLQHQGCVVVSEVEANPEGPDRDHEWIELAHLGLGEMDVSGWTVRALGGAPSTRTLPEGTVIPESGRLVVPFAGQFLDNGSETVVLEAPDGAEYARTPALKDVADDARTHQLATDGTWVFQAGTPGAAP